MSMSQKLPVMQLIAWQMVLLCASRFWEKEPGRNRVPYFLCGSLAEEGTVIKIGGTLQSSPSSNVPLIAKKGPKSCKNLGQAHNKQKEKVLTLTNSGKNPLHFAATCIVGLLPDTPAGLSCGTCRSRTQRGSTRWT